MLISPPSFALLKGLLTDNAGPNGPLPQEILDMYPDAPLIQRQGEVDAWDNADFRAAVKATNKSQVIMAGIVTDVCESSVSCFSITTRHHSHL